MANRAYLLLLSLTLQSLAIHAQAQSIRGEVVQVRMPAEDIRFAFVESRGGMTVELRTESTSVQGRKLYVGDGAVALELEANDSGIWLQKSERFGQGDRLPVGSTIAVKPGYHSAVDLKQGDVYVILQGIKFQMPRRTADGKGKILSLAPDPSGFRALTVSPKGKQITIASVSELRVYDVATGQVRPSATINRPRSGFPGDVVYCPDGEHVVAAGYGGPRKWNLHSGKTILSMPDRDDQTIKALPGSSFTWALAASSDGSLVAAGGRNLITLWKTEVADIRAGNPIAKHVWQFETYDVRKMQATHAAFCPDGERIATTWMHWSSQSDEPHEIEIRRASTGEVIQRIEGGGNGLDFSANGKYLASAAQPGAPEVALWDAATGQLHLKLTGHKHALSEVAFSPNGKYLASSDKAGVIRIWQLPLGDQIRVLRGHFGGVTDLAFDPQGTYLASICPKAPSELIIWDLEGLDLGGAEE